MESLRKYILEMLQEAIEDSSESSKEYNDMKRALKDMGYKYEGKREIGGHQQHMFSKTIGDDTLGVISFGKWKDNNVASGNFVIHDSETGTPRMKDIYAGPINYTGFLKLLKKMKEEEAKMVDIYLGIAKPEAEPEKSHPLVSKDFSDWDETDYLGKYGQGYSMQFNENQEDEEWIKGEWEE